VEKRGARQFITGDDLLTTIDSFTSRGDEKFKQRYFVNPLIDFCTDGAYNGKIGVVFGLRSTGKTVGMLQAAEVLLSLGLKAAYISYNYDEAAVGDAFIEMDGLIKQGFTHFFIDEATYLEGFLNGASEWSDKYTPTFRVKIVIAGTDSFMINIAKLRSLFHRYVQFSTNWTSYNEYREVYGESFAKYKKYGGIFTIEDMSDYINSAIVRNLLHTIHNCREESGHINAYVVSLGSIDEAVMYKAIISILKCIVEDEIIHDFIEHAMEKSTINLGTAISGLVKSEKLDIKRRIAKAMSLYDEFDGIKHPESVIEALLSFLVKIGCLIESFRSISNIGSDKEKIYYISHPALTNYVVSETVKGTSKLEGISHQDFKSGIEQAAEGYINESMAFSHMLAACGENDTVFKYFDFEEREIDIVVVNSDESIVRLIEVKSTNKVHEQRVFSDEARHLYDDAVLANLGLCDKCRISRILVYSGENRVFKHKRGNLLLLNAEDFLINSGNLGSYVDDVLGTGTSDKNYPMYGLYEMKRI
jgi:predicted AAA+ superfamily ATPase